MTGFHDVQFPTNISYGTTGGPMWKTTVVRVDSGAEQRNQNWESALHRWDIRFAIRSPTALATLRAFHGARRGKLYGFRYKDWADYSSASNGKAAPVFTDQVIGVGTGSLFTFQLKKTYSDAGGSWVRTITRPVSGSVLIGINGAQKLQGDATYPWTVNLATGVITFTAAAPPNAQNVTAGFTYDVPARFDTDDLPQTFDQLDVWSVNSIALVEIREC